MSNVYKDGAAIPDEITLGLVYIVFKKAAKCKTYAKDGTLVFECTEDVYNEMEEYYNNSDREFLTKWRFK